MHIFTRFSKLICRVLRGRHLAEEVALRDGDVRADALLTQHLLLCAAPRIPSTLILRSTDSCRGPAGARTGCPHHLPGWCLLSCMSLWRMCSPYFSGAKLRMTSAHKLMSGWPLALCMPLNSWLGHVCRHAAGHGVQQHSKGACMLHYSCVTLVFVRSTARTAEFIKGRACGRASLVYLCLDDQPPDACL